MTGTTTHQVIPLSLSAAVKLRQELDDVLDGTLRDGLNPEELR
ncbi:hypothetical protein GCM10020001_038970 [Nonomuraea salmonea]